MKKIHRFLLQETLPQDTDVVITDKVLVHQIYRVLRMKPGEHIILFTDKGPDTEYEIIAIDIHTLSVKKIAETPVIQPSRTLIAALAITKRDTFEIMVQKLVELGVSEIIPIRTDRTIKQDLKQARLQLIADEALEQCGGTNRLRIHEPMTFSDCLSSNTAYPVYFDTEGKAQTLQEIAPHVIMYVGPEGGWSDGERTLFSQHGVQSIRLGSRILRAETAAIVGAYTLLCL